MNNVKEIGKIFSEVPVAVTYTQGPGEPNVPPRHWCNGVIATTAAYKRLLESEWIENLGIISEPTGENVVDLSRYNIVREQSSEPIHRISVRIADNKFVKIFEGPKSEADKMVAIMRCHFEARR